MGYRENPGWLSTAIGQGIDTFQQFRQLRDERLRRKEDVAFRQAQADEAKKQAEIARLSQQHQDGTLTLLGRKRFAELQGLDSVGESGAETKKRLTAFANTKSGEVDLSALGGTKFKLAGGWENMSDVDRKTIGLPTGDEKKLAGLQFQGLERQGLIDQGKIAAIPLERENLVINTARNGGKLIAPDVVMKAAAKAGNRVTNVKYSDLLADANAAFDAGVADAKYAGMTPGEKEMARKAYIASVGEFFTSQLNDASERARNYNTGLGRSGKTPEDKFVAGIQMQLSRLNSVTQTMIEAAKTNMTDVRGEMPQRLAARLKTDADELTSIALQAQAGNLDEAKAAAADWQQRRKLWEDELSSPVTNLLNNNSKSPPPKKSAMEEYKDQLIADAKKNKKP